MYIGDLALLYKLCNVHSLKIVYDDFVQYFEGLCLSEGYRQVKSHQRCVTDQSCYQSPPLETSK